MEYRIASSLIILLLISLFAIDQVQLERHEVQLDDKFLFGWEVDEENGSIELDATAETRGYVGIGISSKGKMDKAEMSIGGVEDTTNSIYHGVYIGHHHKVKLDRKRKWKLLEARQNETHTYVKYSRPLTSMWLMNTLNLNIPIKVRVINNHIFYK